jgi:PTS system nitrogen regulatory IIA component
MFNLRALSPERSPSPPPAALRRAERNSLVGLLAVEDILLDVDAATPERVFNRIATSIGTRHGLREADVIAGLAAREQLGSTGLGHGVAIPHARLAGVARTIAGFVRLRPAIDFDAPDGKPVSSLLVLLVPELATDAHLVLLAQAASMLGTTALRERLETCVVAPEILAALTGWRSS